MQLYLHYAATSGLKNVLIALIKAADRYAQGFPERKKMIFEWLEITNIFGYRAIDSAKQGYLIFKENNFEASIEILQEALEKYSPDEFK